LPSTSQLIGTRTGSAIFSGNMCELVVYNTEISEADRQLVEGYLAAKWGIQSSLPTNHPYYSISPNYSVRNQIMVCEPLSGTTTNPPNGGCKLCT
jgi:hypothetical protein